VTLTLQALREVLSARERGVFFGLRRPQSYKRAEQALRGLLMRAGVNLKLPT
jgi:hypothetical protein